MPYRLYNHKSKHFLGPPETKVQAWKRLSAITNRMRNAWAAMVRLNVAPAEVLANTPGMLTPKARAELREVFRSRRDVPVTTLHQAGPGASVVTPGRLERE